MSLMRNFASPVALRYGGFVLLAVQTACSEASEAPLENTRGETRAVNWALAHRPALPTAATPLTISVSASDGSVVAKIDIFVDSALARSCTGGTCSHTTTLPEGAHAYSASAVDVDGNEMSVGTGSVLVAPSSPVPPTRFTYSATSPHWRHMRTSTIDYRIHYQRGTQRDVEFDFAAGHYDLVVGGALNEYKSRNPTLRQLAYDLLWTERQADAAAMESWLSANGYNPEDAYLHLSGTAKSTEHRVTAELWNSQRWVMNPGDPGFQAWRKHITSDLVAPRGGHAFDGIMFDEFAVSTIQRTIPAATLEYGSYAAYLDSLRELLVAHRAWVPAGFNILNSYQYFNREEDRKNAIAAGGVMTEFVNSPFTNAKWEEVDYYLDNGVIVEFATGVSSSTKGQQRDDVNPGNYATIAERVLMWEYASYLMVVRPEKMDAVYFETYGLTWSVPHEETWLKAFEYDIGLATGRRSTYARGTDGAGQQYSVVKRDFENGMVLIRAGNGSRYGDATAVDVALPPGTWRMLLADGTLTAPLVTVMLRNSEAVVLVK